MSACSGNVRAENVRPQAAPPRVLVATMLATVGLALACGAGESAPGGPQWVDLSRGSGMHALEELAGRLEARVAPPRASRVVRRDGAEGRADGDPWLELPLAPESWGAGRVPYEWRATLPAGGAMQLCEPASIVLARPQEDGTKEAAQDGAKEWKKALRNTLDPSNYADRFRIDGGELVVFLEEGAAPPALLSARLVGRRAVGGHGRALEGDLVANGFLVFPGEPETLTCTIPPASRLCFATVAPAAVEGETEPRSTTFRVKLAGRPLFEHVQPSQRVLRAKWHALPLALAGPQQLVFEVEGTAPALFAAPVLAPAESGRPGARPWPDAPPDVVMLVLDTFRADNLAAWGGTHGSAPNLDALVERSLRFLDARAAAAWTLPSIGSLLSGLHPGQHGATDLDRSLVPEAETLPEVLARHGYRTVALTDSAFFSRHYGQDQGFEWFEETPNAGWPGRTTVTNWNLADTLAKARQRMAADDGRPLFLVVHTYRVHDPLRLGPGEDVQPWQDAIARLAEEGKDDAHPEYRGAARRFYLRAVADLDDKVGAWLDELEEDGFFERGLLVVTADHGHSFGEHGQLGHGGDLFDVKLRVPLALAGAGIVPGDVHGVVSLVDLAPTLAALAGAAPSPTWTGRSLLAAGDPRPVYAFDLREKHRQVALFAGSRKLIAGDAEALRAGRPSHAFELGTDPEEADNLAGRAPWPEELGRELAAMLAPLVVPLGAGGALELSPEKLEELQAIGYGD